MADQIAKDEEARKREDGGDTEEHFRSLLEGLRTTLPSVQVLFGFLLVLPFQSTFVEVSSLAQFAYTVAFYGSAVALILLVAPSVHQRVRAPRTGIPRRSWSDLAAAVYLTIAGSIAFLISLGAGVFLVSIVVYEEFLASIALAVVAVLSIWAWFYLPLFTFERRDSAES